MAAIVSLLSDFGLSDPYVGVMKARVLAHAPAAPLVDLTHAVAPGDVRVGAFLLAQAAPWFPDGAVHLAVVDPGVGTSRRAVAVQAGGAFFVGPDNGLLTLALAGRRVRRAVVLTIPPRASPTFHGRDVFAPAAGQLAAGAALESLGRPAGRLVTLDWPRPRRRGATTAGEIVHVDRFGNLVTNLRTVDGGELSAGDFRTRRISRTYGDVAPGQPLALRGSHGFIEVAVRDGSAAEVLGVTRGDKILVRHRIF
jgi:S-adenosyl-L-methionine hydrolase (adenosine-forming)